MSEDVISLNESSSSFEEGSEEWETVSRNEDKAASYRELLDEIGQLDEGDNESLIELYEKFVQIKESYLP